MGQEDERGDLLALKTIHLSEEHNSDNLNEIKRIFAEHPAKEQNNIIKGNRLLGQLMPLRAFGDFGYKWPVEKIKRVGLTRAFGPHVIPPFYQTPPYLTCEPEVTELTESHLSPSPKGRQIVLATDGLWEQFEAPRHVTRQVIYHKNHDKKWPESPDDQSAASISATASGATLDANGATHLLRYSLGQNPSIIDPHRNSDVEQQRLQEHKRLVTFLTLPESVVRNFKDDISIIILHLS